MNRILHHAALSRESIVVRAVAGTMAVLVAAVIVAVDPAPTVVIFGCLAALCASAGVVAPRSPWPTVSLVLLASAYTVASTSATLTVLTIASVAMAAALWIIHVLYGLAAAIPAGATVDPAVVVRFRQRLVLILAPALPAVAVSGILGFFAPNSLWLRAVGIVAAIAVALIPLLLVRGRSRDREPAARQQGGQREVAPANS